MIKSLLARRAIQAALVALTLMVGLLLATPTAASANPGAPCTSWSAWYYPPSGAQYGTARFCYEIDFSAGLVYWRFQVQDILTDGYAVHLEACTDTGLGAPCVYNTFGDVILDDSGTNGCNQSVGSVVTSNWPGITSSWYPIDPLHSRVSLRVVRGRCEGGAHQDTAHFDLWLSD